MSNLFSPVLCMKKGSLPLPRRLFFQSGLFVCLRGWLSAGLHTQKKIVNEFSTKACKKDGARAKEQTAGRVFTRHICAHNPSVRLVAVVVFVVAFPCLARGSCLETSKNIIRHESLITLVTYTTQSRFTAKGKKKKPRVLDFSSDSLKQRGATQTNQRAKNKEEKRLAGGFTTTAHMDLTKDVITGERMRRRKQDLVLYILFTSYSP